MSQKAGVPVPRWLVYAFGGFLFFGLTNFPLKYCGHHGTDSIRATAVLWLSGGTCGVLALAGTDAMGRGLAGLDTPLLKGPAAAIIGSNAVLVTLLEWAVFGHVPPSVKLAGMVVSLGGIFLLALAGFSARVCAGVSSAVSPHLER